MDNKRTMLAISAASLRVLINAANEEGIQKEDIVTLIKEGDEFVLVYYSK